MFTKKEDSDLREAIKLREKLLKELKQQLECEHELVISAGDNISTTGPTGLYEYCRKCGREKEVGYIGSKGRVFYAVEADKRRAAKLKAKKVGLTQKDIDYLQE